MIITAKYANHAKTGTGTTAFPVASSFRVVRVVRGSFGGWQSRRHGYNAGMGAVWKQSVSGVFCAMNLSIKNMLTIHKLRGSMENDRRSFRFSLTRRFLQRQGLGLLIAVMPIIAGCNSRSGEFMQGQMVGTWSAVLTNIEEIVCRESLVVESNGVFTVEVTPLQPRQGQTTAMTGTLELSNNVATMTTLKHTSPNAVLPFSQRVRVIKIGADEMVIEPIPEGGQRYASMVTYERVRKVHGAPSQ